MAWQTFFFWYLFVKKIYLKIFYLKTFDPKIFWAQTNLLREKCFWFEKIWVHKCFVQYWIKNILGKESKETSWLYFSQMLLTNVLRTNITRTNTIITNVSRRKIRFVLVSVRYSLETRTNVTTKNIRGQMYPCNLQSLTEFWSVVLGVWAHFCWKFM